MEEIKIKHGYLGLTIKTFESIDVSTEGDKTVWSVFVDGIYIKMERVHTTRNGTFGFDKDNKIYFLG